MSTKSDCINVKGYVENALARLEQLEKNWSANIKQQKSNSEGNVLKKDFKSLPHTIENLAFMEHAIQVFQIVCVLCQMFLKKVDVIQKTTKEDLHGDLEELVTNFMWVCPRLTCFAPELAVVCEYFIIIYGKEFAEICFENRSEKVHPALLRIINNSAMVEKIMEHFKYFMEFAKRNKVDVDPVKQRASFKFRAYTLSVLTKAEMRAAKKWKTYVPVIHLCQCESGKDLEKQQIRSSENSNERQRPTSGITYLVNVANKKGGKEKEEEEEETSFSFRITAFERSLPVNLRSAVYLVHSLSEAEYNKLVLLRLVDNVNSKTKSKVSTEELVELIKIL
ncbi:IST1 -like protein [Trichinella zimbabwensis]|uniref:IST1 homolog n=1 Tax=Trichinella zimbabwensis TaxID=268475 RepID=A0A0V1HJT4_9BILA|nr:IST1 -like protein [Trichinella zimbabwensis]